MWLKVSKLCFAKNSIDIGKKVCILLETKFGGTFTHTYIEKNGYKLNIFWVTAWVQINSAGECEIILCQRLKFIDPWVLCMQPA